MNQNGGFKLNKNTILLGLLILGAILVFGPQLFGGNAEPNEVPRDTDTNEPTSQTVDDGISLGTIVVSESVDRNGCPVATTSTLNNVNFFYVIAPDSEIPEGTDVFVRLYKDDQAVEDLPAITANQDYDNTCINFVFETTNGRTFADGRYEAEFFVNGNAYDSVTFDIQ